MQTTVKKWGNSYSVRIPKNIVNELSLEDDCVLELTTHNNQIILTSNVKEQKLQKLLSGVEKQKEIDWGSARGKESW